MLLGKLFCVDLVLVALFDFVAMIASLVCGRCLCAQSPHQPLIHGATPSEYQHRLPVMRLKT
jgi:hypothetical protein